MVVVAPALTPLTVIVPSAAPLHETLVLAALTVTATAGWVRVTSWQVGSIVNAAVVLLQPVPVTENVNEALPDATPVTTPAFVTVATDGLLLTQAPPVAGVNNEATLPKQSEVLFMLTTGA